MTSVQDKNGTLPVSELLDKVAGVDSTLVLLVGPPASGKSTISDGLDRRGFYRLSMDAIRGELFGDEGIYRDQDKLKALMMERFRAALAAHWNIYIDNTNCFRKQREELIEKARAAGYNRIVLVVMRTPLDACIERNKLRSRVAPEDVIRTMHAAVEGSGRPSTKEGWIIEVQPGHNREHVVVNFRNQL